jgi:hypothetical protein
MPEPVGLCVKFRFSENIGNLQISPIKLGNKMPAPHELSLRALIPVLDFSV